MIPAHELILGFEPHVGTYSFNGNKYLLLNHLFNHVTVPENWTKAGFENSLFQAEEWRTWLKIRHNKEILTLVTVAPCQWPWLVEYCIRNNAIVLSANSVYYPNTYFIMPCAYMEEHYSIGMSPGAVGWGVELLVELSNILNQPKPELEYSI
jgi:hypothetical protein